MINASTTSTAVPKSNQSQQCVKCCGTGKVQVAGMPCTCFACRGTGKASGTIQTK